jgi:hypothetical protein
MKLGRVVGACALVAVVTAGGVVLSQDKTAMEAYMKATAPGDHHKYFDRMEGEWVGVGKAWMSPKQPPMETKGVAKFKKILGGRFLEEEYEGGEMAPGMPYQGHALYGYDYGAKKHTAIWLDNTGTGMLVLSGECEGDCHKITTSGTYTTPLGKKLGWRQVVTHETDAFTVEAWNVVPEGVAVPEGKPREVKVSEAKYTRKK